MNLSIGKIRRNARGKISAVFTRALMIIVPKISISKLLAIGRYTGVMIYYISRKHRLRALNNLDIVFGANKSDSEKKKIAKSAFQDFGKTGLESIFFHSSPKYVLKERVKIEGREHLDKALEQGKGVIGLTAHFGNFMALHGKLGIEGYRVNSVVKALRDKGVEDIMSIMRAGVGVKTIYVSPNTKCIRACYNALTANEIVVLLNDQPQKHGIEVDFCGSPVQAAAGPAFLALATCAVVLPMFAIRNKDNTHKIMINKPVPIVRTEDKKHDIIVNTQAFNKITESYVLSYPEQWAWNQRRWRCWKKNSDLIKQK